MQYKKSAIGYLIFLIAALAAAQAPQPPQVPAQFTQQEPRPELQTIVQRMEQAARENREKYRAYVITREYRMYGGGEQKPGSTVVADISFVPPKTQEFKITETQGSARGENVVRHILENEQRAAETGQAPGAVTRENYEFTLQGEQRVDEHDCFVLGLTPKHKEKNLIVGRAWVDKNTYLVRRVQGEMAKMPSWWIKSVEVTLDFGDVSGMWMKTHTTANADVRVFGPHTLQENAIRVRTGSTVAEVAGTRAQQSRRSFRRAEAVLGTFQH
ncbi:MAG TPA: outer membrane lipoprotein-sorting protein [Terriglobales bacterium]|nr:outer membrane lipoprotein-sorting protein [Terriglobales bacterium]